MAVRYPGRPRDEGAAREVRPDEGIRCVVPAAAAALVREALALALPGVPVTVTADDALPAGGARRRGTYGASVHRQADEDAHAVGAHAEAALATARAALRHTQQRVAASEAAMRLQHALANPLTALLFEAQLLEMEVLPPALAEAVGRIVTQCRRTIEVARRLDAAGAPAAPLPRHDIRNPM